MNMSEYLQKRQQIAKDSQKPVQDRMKELQEAEQRAKEIREALKAEQKKKLDEKIHNFSLLGMGFRPWTLNDMVILLVIAVIVVGGLSFVPNGEVTSDTNTGGFFTNLFGGFAVKSVEDENTDISNSDSSNEISNEETAEVSEVSVGSSDSTVDETNQETIDESKLANFDIDVNYQGSSFALINVSNTKSIWYTLKLTNKNLYPIKCNINHYVNNVLKNDKSTVSIEAGDYREINLREVAEDTVKTLSKVKLEVECSDGSDISTQRTQTKLLKFYFS